MPSHKTVTIWGGDYDCPYHCGWHNWAALKQKLAGNSAAVGDAVRRPGGVVEVAGAEVQAEVVSEVEELRSLVRSRAERLKVIRALEGLGIERLKQLQERQEKELAGKGEPINLGEVDKVMGLIFRTWDEERLELGKPTQIIGAEIHQTQAIVDVAEVLQEMDAETRRAFIAAYRRRLASALPVVAGG